MARPYVSRRKLGAAAIGSALWKQRVSEGTKRALKPWNDGLRVLHPHVRAFLGGGQVDPAMRPMVSDATLTSGEYAEQLGGEQNLSVGERVLLRQLWKLNVALDAMFSRVIRDGDLSVLEGLGSLLSAERACVAALGIKRVERQVPSLETYLAQRPQNGASITLDVPSDLEGSGDA